MEDKRNIEPLSERVYKLKIARLIAIGALTVTALFGGIVEHRAILEHDASITIERAKVEQAKAAEGKARADEAHAMWEHMQADLVRSGTPCPEKK